MTVLSVLLFSLTWGAIVWLVMTAFFHGGLERLCSPGAYLTSVVAVVVPCFLIATGWSIPVPSPQVPVFTVGETGQGLLDVTATVGRAVNPPVWHGAVWLPAVILSIYATGLIVQLFRTVRSLGGLARLLRDARPHGGFHAKWPVLVTTAPVAPFAVGGRRPSIVLPELMVRDWSEERVALIIRHEEAHLRHRDPDIAFVLGLVVAFFWFNPFIRGLVARWRDCCELRADGTALQGAAASRRKFYAGTLLDAMRIPAGSDRGSLSTSFTTRSLRSDKMRISAILKGFHFSSRGPRNLIAHCAVWSLVAVGSAGALATAAAPITLLDSFIHGGRVTSPYGVTRAFRRDHTGVDVAAQIRTPIAAPADAVVMQATDLFRGQWKWGKAVVLQFDDGLVVWFTHLDSYRVKPGDRVAKGAHFATVGNSGQSTGPHVHIEVYRGPERIDPASVWPFLTMSKK